MAKFNQGVHGQFSGKIGNVVGSSWKGKGVMRIRPASVSNPKTEKQQTVRGKFSLVGRFVARLSSLVADGFKSQADVITAQNAAMKYNLQHGLLGEFPDLSLNMSALKISQGDLPSSTDLVAVKNANLLEFSWSDNSNEAGAASNDLLSIGIYDSEQEQALKFQGIFSRGDAGGIVEIPANWLDRTIDIYAFFKSQSNAINSGLYVSDSIYLGSIDMSA
jgi:hypothetical protein